MIMKRRIRLSESDLHKVIKETVKRCLNEADSYGWYVDDNDPETAYYFAIENGGWDEESLNAAIVGCMSKEEKAKCLAFLFRMDNFQAWKDREMYDNESEY